MKKGTMALFVLLFSLSIAAQDLKKEDSGAVKTDGTVVEEKKDGDKKEEAAPEKTEELEMQKGTVINLTDTILEIKAGRDEWQFSMTDKTKVLFKGKPVARASLLPCQFVEVRYVQDEQDPRAAEIDILADTQCAK